MTKASSKELMHSEIQELVALLENAQSLLLGYGEERWSKRLGSDAFFIKNLDFYGIEHLQTAFGGMGSINDLVIHPINGHKIQAGEVNSANEELSLLLNKISTLARKLTAQESNVR